MLDITVMVKIENKVLQFYIAIATILTIFNRINWDWKNFFFLPIGVHIIFTIICFVLQYFDIVYFNIDEH